uniref:Macrophage-expressed gene 1 protein n=1 Tax=Panagrolaimus sp. ES5 TaxID=591445 RepID=A0AC34F3Q0_9BILA
MLILILLGCSFVLFGSSVSADNTTALFDSQKQSYLSPEDTCIAHIREHIKERKISRNLGGIVGIGWDSLTNEATLPVFSQTYKLCRTVPDGDYLVPDNVVVLPIKEANLHKSSEMFDSFSSYKTSTGGSLSVSAGGGVPGIAEVSGSMSVETKVGKEHMEKHKQTAFSNKIEYRAFTLIGTEKAGFDEIFEERLNEIVKAIKDGNRVLAQYEAESIIGDYGTHVTNKAVAGASVTMLSFADTTEVEDKKSFALKVSTDFHASFMGAVSMGLKASADHESSQDDETKFSTSQSYIFTKGGPDVNRLLSDSGNKMTIDSVVGLDRHGMPLYSLIHPKVLKDKRWDDLTTYMIQDYLYNATQEFIRHNTIPGCTDSSSPMYFHKANANDNVACTREYDQRPFNGYYQTCEYIESYSKAHSNLTHGNQCDQYMHSNPVTNKFTCPDGSEPSDSIDFYVTYKHRAYKVKPGGCNASDCSVNYTITDRIKVTTLICNNYKTNSTMSLFGGIFQSQNIFSDNKRCAQGFDEYPILHNHKICIAILKKDEEISEYYKATAIGFYGFEGCGETKCYFAGTSPYYLTTINNCPYYYCVALPEENSFAYYSDTLLPSVSRPPYIDRDMAFKNIRLNYEREIDKIEEEAIEKMLTADGTEVGEIIN